MTIPSWFVIVMGMGTVFIGLVCIVLLCKILSAVCSLFDGKSKDSKEFGTSEVKNVSAQQNTLPAFPNRQEVIAVIGAVIAEDCGVDVEAIRIKSIKRI
jgi:Na+-transporting methylmalonyl-CoA/oxaloacetate decarboxylase gamma subunit